MSASGAAGSWSGGSFGERARCLLAPNANEMTLDGTNTWVLREPGAARSVVVDPGPEIMAHLDAVAEAGQTAGEVAVVLLTHHHLDHSEAARDLRRARRVRRTRPRPGLPARLGGPRRR